jgi:Tfp pilus assembly protein PilF
MLTQRIRRLGPHGIPLLVGLLTAAVFARGLGNDFVEWDDHANFVDNQDFRGLAWKNLRWMFTTALMGQWIPFTWMTLGLDYVLWGMNPLGYHLTNLLVHSLGAIAFCFVAIRLLGAATGWSGPLLVVSGSLAALFFAIHPLRAESVAWATERRDVLSGLWLLLTVLTYVKAADGTARRRPWLAASVACFGLAVLSKSMVVTLPAILVLLDVYPLRRLTGSPRTWLTERRFRTLWLEKLPYLGLAALGIGMAFWAQRVNAFLTPLEKLSLVDRLVIVVHSLWFYLATTVLPLGLVPVYELPARIDVLESRFLVSVVGVTALTAAFVLLRRRWPAGLTVWAAYAIMLSPVSGIFHNGHQLVHDRYSYLPCLGWALLFGAGVGAVLQAGARRTVRPAMARLAVGVGGLVLVGYATITVHQVRVWRDTDSLWRFALESDPQCALCRNNLGVHLYRRGLTNLAMLEFQQSAALRPDRVRTRANIGLAYLRTNRPREAMQEFQKVLKQHPRDLDIRANLGVALLDQGQAKEAVRVLGDALGENPSHLGANVNMGVALVQVGRPDEALPYLQRAFELQPAVSQTRVGLIRAWLGLGRPDLAIEEYEALRKLDTAAARQAAPLLMAEW